MSQQLVDDQLWKTRITGANRYHDQWEALFKCKVLEKYYEGFQWKSQRQLDFSPYVINKVYETVQFKIAQFCPTFLKYLVTAKPANSDSNLELAAGSSQLKEDVLNTLIWDQKLNFSSEVEYCYKDSFTRFGVMEVGYEADWIVNPNANKPNIAKDIKQNAPNRSAKAKFQPPELPTNERIYFKHIGARRFRVGGLDNKYLQRCGWYGYFEWVDKDELLSHKLMNRAAVEGAAVETHERNASEPYGETNDFDPDTRKTNAVKIWHIWDNKTKMRLVVLDSPCLTIYQKKFKRQSIFDLRPDKRLLTEGFYPIPPVFHWLSAQDEINEIREQLRNHRRRFVRKYGALDGVDDVELEKFETGPDGAVIKLPRPDALFPIDAPDLGNVIPETIQTSNDDINQISGISSEQRLVSDRSTATESNIINQASQTRGQKERDRIVEWLSGVGREALLLCREKFTIGIWARLVSNPAESFLGEIQSNSAAFRWVTTEELNDGYDFRIDVDVTSLSVAAQVEEKQKFVEFLTLVTQFPTIALSPILIREAAYRVGYRNEAIIKEMQKSALLQHIGQMQQMQNAAGGNQIAQGRAAQMAPPTAEKARNQMKNQMVMPQ